MQGAKGRGYCIRRRGEGISSKRFSLSVSLSLSLSDSIGMRAVLQESLEFDIFPISKQRERERERKREKESNLERERERARSECMCMFVRECD